MGNKNNANTSNSPTKISPKPSFLNFKNLGKKKTSKKEDEFLKTCGKKQCKNSNAFLFFKRAFDFLWTMHTSGA